MNFLVDLFFVMFILFRLYGYFVFMPHEYLSEEGIKALGTRDTDGYERLHVVARIVPWSYLLAFSPAPRRFSFLMFCLRDLSTAVHASVSIK